MIYTSYKPKYELQCTVQLGEDKLPHCQLISYDLQSAVSWFQYFIHHFDHTLRQRLANQNGAKSLANRQCTKECVLVCYNEVMSLSCFMYCCMRTLLVSWICFAAKIDTSFSIVVWNGKHVVRKRKTFAEGISHNRIPNQTTHCTCNLMLSNCLIQWYLYILHNNNLHHNYTCN